MKSMPNSLKQKLRQYDKANTKARELHYEITQELDRYGVPYEHLVANHNLGSSEPTTEALAYINNCEGYIEDNIDDIEEVFLYFVNKE